MKKEPWERQAMKLRRQAEKADPVLRIHRLKWEAELADKRRRCVHSTGDQFVSDLTDYLHALNSEQRAGELLSLLNRAAPKEFWQSFLVHWSGCDRTWEYTARWLRLLGKTSGKVSGYHYYDNSCRAFFDDLPELVTVYRGCSRERVNGISWTTDKSVAKGFAQGHRSIRVPNPVLATAKVAKNEILAAMVDRQEREVICNAQHVIEIEDCRA